MLMPIVAFLFPTVPSPPHMADIRAAMDHVGISPEKAAQHMGMDASQLRRELNGDGHLSFKRLMLMPLEFRQWLWLLGAERDGMPKVMRQAVRFALALRARKRITEVAKMALATSGGDERRRA